MCSFSLDKNKYFVGLASVGCCDVDVILMCCHRKSSKIVYIYLKLFVNCIGLSKCFGVLIQFCLVHKYIDFSYTIMYIMYGRWICVQLISPRSFRVSVEWSNSENFTTVTGEVTVEDVRQLEFEIQGLVKGSQYYVRVSACNMKGCGTSTLSNPPCAVPSSKLYFFCS